MQPRKRLSATDAMFAAVLILSVIAIVGLELISVAAGDTPDTTNTVPAVFRDEGGDRLVLASDAELWNGIGVGAIGVTSTGFTLAEGGAAIHQTVFTLDGVEDLMVDSGANGGHMSLKLYDFPAGYLKFLGASLDVDVACGTAGFAAAATYDFGLGTTATATDNAALATTEQNILTKIEGNMSAQAVSLGSAYATDVAIDGHTTAADLYLNAAIEADDASTNDFCTYTGTVTVTWLNLGDY